jgi:iron(III) transport system ATP-binding protein
MIRITGLKKSYVSDQGIGKIQQVKAVRGLDIEVTRGCFFTLLGPSGCGKTTTLRCVAGLVRPEEGEIAIDNMIVYSSKGVWVLPNKRGLGMVFQSYAIWPHMTVFQNVAFPLIEGPKRFKKTEIRDKVRRGLELVHLEGLENRPAPQLSGGQQQRLALARALVAEPKVLLLDEPLSNLDARLREEMRTEIRSLVKGLGITTMYVTHDQIEALSLSDRIAVMNEGTICQVGTPIELYLSPNSVFVAQFIGSNNFFSGTVIGSQVKGKGEIDVQGTILRVSEHVTVNERIILAIRPQDIEMMKRTQDLNMENVIQGEIKRAIFLGEVGEYEVETQELGGKTLLVKGSHYYDFEERGRVYLSLPPSFLKVIKGSETLDLP